MTWVRFLSNSVGISSYSCFKWFLLTRLCWNYLERSSDLGSVIFFHTFLTHQTGWEAVVIIDMELGWSSYTANKESLYIRIKYKYFSFNCSDCAAWAAFSTVMPWIFEKSTEVHSCPVALTTSYKTFISHSLHHWLMEDKLLCRMTWAEWQQLSTIQGSHQFQVL